MRFFKGTFWALLPLFFASLSGSSSLQYLVGVPVRQTIAWKNRSLEPDSRFALTGEIFLQADVEVTHQDEEGLEVVLYVHRLKVTDYLKEGKVSTFDSEEPGKTRKDWFCKRCLKRAFALPIHLHVDTKKGRSHIVTQDLQERFAQFPKVVRLLLNDPYLFTEQFLLGSEPLIVGSSFTRQQESEDDWTEAHCQIAKCDEEKVEVTYSGKLHLKKKDLEVPFEGVYSWNCSNGLLVQGEFHLLLSIPNSSSSSKSDKMEGIEGKVTSEALPSR